MIVRAFRLRRLPASLRPKSPLFLRACRLALGPAARRRGELSIIFTTNPQIRAINRRFLGHDYATDVIAFRHPSGGRRLKEPPAFGDVYVSVDQARKQAAELGHSLLEELLTLAAHGTLHLVGYDDLRKEDRERMFKRQAAISRRVFHG